MLGSRGYVQFPGCNCWGGVWIIRHLAKLPLHRKQKGPILYFPKGKLCKSVRKDEDMLFSKKVWTPYQTRGRTFGKMKKWNPKVDPLSWRRGWGLTFHFVGKDHIRDISTPLFFSTIFGFWSLNSTLFFLLGDFDNGASIWVHIPIFSSRQNHLDYTPKTTRAGFCSRAETYSKANANPHQNDQWPIL